MTTIALSRPIKLLFKEQHEVIFVYLRLAIDSRA